MKDKKKVDELFQKADAKKKLTNEELIICIISKQLEPFNKSYYDVVGREDDWFSEYEVSPQQSEEWRNWSSDFIRKNAKSSLLRNKKQAKKEMLWIDLMWGLKTKGGSEAVDEYERQKKSSKKQKKSSK
jgi:hypothetical protein